MNFFEKKFQKHVLPDPEMSFHTPSIVLGRLGTKLLSSKKWQFFLPKNENSHFVSPPFLHFSYDENLKGAGSGGNLVVRFPPPIRPGF